ncbi:hypothetical protein SKAU_G00327140 [Synaphobranchus kaupii]|uniref:Uncharacterized protein n=1 Tax=Synaphobranchus kaupii TaxID=118154 RepID=A0A9Q1EQ20_SYNKA|nr:hypothetical protein SKAU_G00327140 [Synaphobranchus kaupii]
MGLVEEVKALRLQNSEKDRRIVLLENRVADLEQYSRMNDIIVSRLEIKPRFYARAVSIQKGEELTEQDSISVEEHVSAFLHSKGIELDINNIEACHPFPRRLKTDKPALIIRKARFLRNQKKIHSTWTTNCKIFIKLNGPPEESKVLVIRNMEDLDKFQ